jgi:hypothetical protein
VGLCVSNLGKVNCELVMLMLAMGFQRDLCTPQCSKLGFYILGLAQLKVFVTWLSN